MPRKKRKISKRVFPPDSKYNSYLVTQFINKVLMCGEKTVAEKIVYGALEEIHQKARSEPLEILEKACANVTPKLEVKPRRVGGATYQIPREVSRRRGRSLCIRWIVNFARQRKGKPMFIKLAGELMDAAKGLGNSVKKKQDTHKMAEANRAFAHYRW